MFYCGTVGRACLKLGDVCAAIELKNHGEECHAANCSRLAGEIRRLHSSLGRRPDDAVLGSNV